MAIKRWLTNVVISTWIIIAPARNVDCSKIAVEKSAEKWRMKIARTFLKRTEKKKNADVHDKKALCRGTWQSRWAKNMKIINMLSLSRSYIVFSSWSSHLFSLYLRNVCSTLYVYVLCRSRRVLLLYLDTFHIRSFFLYSILTSISCSICGFCSPFLSHSFYVTKIHIYLFLTCNIHSHSIYI